MDRNKIDILTDYVDALNNLNNAFKKVSDMNAIHKEIGHYESDSYPFSENLQVMQKMVNNWVVYEMREVKSRMSKCFKIDGKIYLRGNFNEEEQAHEFFDMTTEMETGKTFSQYIQDESSLEEASEEETEKVIEYLMSL